MAWTVPWNLVGLLVSGDVDGVTVYTDRFGKKVVFPVAPPDKPPSTLQSVQRGRFTSAVSAYRALTTAEKTAYELIVQRGSLCLTGQNLFIKVALKRQYRSLDTLMHQTGVTVPYPPPL